MHEAFHLCVPETLHIEGLWFRVQDLGFRI